MDTDIKRCAVIEDSVVVNTVLAEKAVAQELGWIVLDAGDPASVGWIWDGVAFTPPPTAAG